jgi:methyltransferase
MDTGLPPQTRIAAMALGVVAVSMLMEVALSRVNERRLRRRGAIFPRDDVYPTMQWAYPGCFAVMAVEGMLWGPAPGVVTWTGAGLLILAKALKGWVIVSLGRHWTYRIVIVPGQTLSRRGPYAVLRHPNYVAVVGELAGMALLVGAAVTGPPATLFYVWLLRRRVLVETRAHVVRSGGV